MGSIPWTCTSMDLHFGLIFSTGGLKVAERVSAMPFNHLRYQLDRWNLHAYELTGRLGC